MTRELVLVHGRAQQGKDAAALKAEWLECLESGLRRSGLTLPVDEGAVRFPYYGDTLVQLVGGAEGDDVADIVVRGDAAEDAAAAAFLDEVLREVAVRQEVTAAQAEAVATASDEVVARGIANAKFVLGLLRYLDDNVPLASGPALALATKDVYHYLTNSRVSDRIDGGVAAAFTPGVESVVVAHSLGSVVAYRLLHSARASAWSVPELITVGCPLGVRAVSSRLAAQGVHGFPPVTPRWFNALDPQDVVALRPLQPPWFDSAPAVDNKADVVNTTPNQHGISGYLGDPVVARRIHDALVAD